MTRADNSTDDRTLAGRLGSAVLFDIDDTLVDLEQAMGRTLREIPDPTLSHLGEDDWARYTALYTSDPERHYNRFLAGELSFEEQRIHRIRHARATFTQDPFAGPAVDAWARAYEVTLPRHFAMYDDVAPLLDALDEQGVRYGAVSNNVHAYQRAKLDRAGLQRVEVLVGIDTVGVAKPEPAIYLEGVRLLGSEPHTTLYVGDNREVDAVGARNAGLIGVWLDRTRPPASGALPDRRPEDAEDAVADEVPTISTLHAVLQFLPPIR